MKYEIVEIKEQKIFKGRSIWVDSSDEQFDYSYFVGYESNINSASKFLNEIENR